MSGPAPQPSPLIMPSSQVATFVHVGPAGQVEDVVALVVAGKQVKRQKGSRRSSETYS